MSTLETTFRQGLHCLLRQKQSFVKGIYYLKIITCDSSIYTMNYPKFFCIKQEGRNQLYIKAYFVLSFIGVVQKIRMDEIIIPIPILPCGNIQVQL